MAHTHEDDRGYYVDQLCTIAVCALLGAMCVALWTRNSLGLLADPFHLAVFLGGVALLVVSAVRGVTLWATFSQKAQADSAHAHTHGHDHHHHDHGEEGGHDHHHHDHPHEHDHDHHHHEHDHGHSHGWNPIRYVFLIIPLVLSLVGLPNPAFNDNFREYLTQLEAGKLGREGYDVKLVGKMIDTLGLQVNKEKSDEALAVVRTVKDGAAEKAGIRADDKITAITPLTDDEGKDLKEPETFDTSKLSLDEAANKLRGKPRTKVRLTLAGEGTPRDVELTREVVIQNLGFKELERAAFDAFARQAYEGMTVRLKGQYVPRTDKQFSLIRVKITCCAADAIPLNVVISLDPKSPENVVGLGYMQWIEVTGQVTFVKRRDRNEYVPVLQVASRAEGIRPTAPETFLQ